MKRILIVLCVLLIVLIGLVLCNLGWAVGLWKLNPVTGNNFDLANQLFFEALAEGRIEIFTTADMHGTQGTYEEYAIVIRPLRLDEPGTDNFVAHNHGCVRAFACKKWMADRELAIVLFTLMSKVDPSSARILAEYKENGTFGGVITEEAFQYEWRSKKYGPTQQ